MLVKCKTNLLEQLKPLPYFSKESFYQLGKQLELSDSSIDTYISRFLNRKEIFQLKRGLYITSDFFNKNKADVSYSFYLANVIRTPSYISSWSALQFYNLATEAVYDVTSVTPKVTRNYQTKVGHFTYQSIREDLFSGFSLVQGAGAFNFFIASPAKALFDLLYFRTRQFRGIQKEDIKVLVEELRIDIDEMDKKERNTFYSMTKAHIGHE
jgi:predicted transcriptional regulator of viral defense system